MKTFYKTSIIIVSLFLLSATAPKKGSLKHALKVLNGFCNFVPSGNSVIDGDTISVQSFYMSKSEITNINFMEFIYFAKKTMSPEKFKRADVDTSMWGQYYPQTSKTYGKYYYTHPAYHKYPVVNVSREGAEMYCEWLSAIYDSISDQKLKIKFRIPSRAEWIRAARGNNHSAVYSWNTPILTNSDGLVQANFVRIGAEKVTRNTTTNKLELAKDLSTDLLSFEGARADILAPVESYWPNNFGFYNMNGNASEMISDGDFSVGGDWNSPGYDIRNESIKPFTGANPTVGFRIVATYIKPEK